MSLRIPCHHCAAETIRAPGRSATGADHSSHEPKATPRRRQTLSAASAGPAANREEGTGS